MREAELAIIMTEIKSSSKQRFRNSQTACGLAVCIVVLVTLRLGSINANGISFHTSIPEQGIRETDRDFLDDLARKNDQDDHGDDNSLPEVSIPRHFKRKISVWFLKDVY